MKTILILIFLLLSSVAYSQVEVTHVGIQGSAGARYAVFMFKNTTKKPLKNIVVAYDVTIKVVNKSGKQWETKTTEMVEVKEIKPGQTYEHKHPYNDSVVQIISSAFSSVIQK